MDILVSGPGVSAELLGGGDGCEPVQPRGPLALDLQQALQLLGGVGVRGDGHGAGGLAAVARVVLLTDHRAFHWDGRVLVRKGLYVNN